MAPRLDAPAAAPAPPFPVRSGHQRGCLECGTPLPAASASSEFCAKACRKAWHNRRAIRGAELYDLFMATRFDRATAKALHLWRIINRLASMFREEDRKERGGRMSWRAPAIVLDRRPYLRAERLKPMKRRDD
jgi:hypothetical protein